MKLYRTTYYDDEQPANLEKQEKWDGSRTVAHARRVALKAQGMRSVDTEPVLLPMKKPALLAFLNKEEGTP